MRSLTLRRAPRGPPRAALVTLAAVLLAPVLVPAPAAAEDPDPIEVLFPTVEDVLARSGLLYLEWRVQHIGYGETYVDVGLDNSVHAYSDDGRYRRVRNGDVVENTWFGGDPLGLRVDAGGEYGGSADGVGLDAQGNVHVAMDDGHAWYLRKTAFGWGRAGFWNEDAKALALGPSPVLVSKEGWGNVYARRYSACGEDVLASTGHSFLVQSNLVDEDDVLEELARQGVPVPTDGSDPARCLALAQLEPTGDATDDPRARPKGVWRETDLGYWGGPARADANAAATYVVRGPALHAAELTGTYPEADSVDTSQVVFSEWDLGVHSYDFDVAAGPVIAPMWGTSSTDPGLPTSGDFLVAYGKDDADDGSHVGLLTCAAVVCFVGAVAPPPGSPEDCRNPVTSVAVRVGDAADRFPRPWVAYSTQGPISDALCVAHYNGESWSVWQVPIPTDCDNGWGGLDGVHLGLGPFNQKVPVLGFNNGGLGCIAVPALVDSVTIPSIGSLPRAIGFREDFEGAAAADDWTIRDGWAVSDEQPLAGQQSLHAAGGGWAESAPFVIPSMGPKLTVTYASGSHCDVNVYVQRLGGGLGYWEWVGGGSHGRHTYSLDAYAGMPAQIAIESACWSCGWWCTGDWWSKVDDIDVVGFDSV